MSSIVAFLVKTRVFDAGQTVDLSALALAVVLGRLAVVDTFDWATVIALLLVLLNYNAKKYFSVIRESKTVSDAEKMQHMESEIKQLHSAVNFQSLGR